MGALQVGMLRALIERRIHPDLVLGCSVGALNGVVIASSPSLASVGLLQDAWMDVVARDLLPAGLLPSTMQLVRKGEAIQSSEALRNLVGHLLPVERFEDLKIPFQCVATNVDAAVEHWFHSGDLVDALLASASIPAVFPAVEIDGTRYFDGAVVDDVPVERAVELGATRIFVLQVGGVDRPRPEPRRPLDMAVLAYWIARRHRLLDDLARIPDDVEVIILPHGNPAPVRYNDLSRSAQLMDVAYRASAEHLDARLDGRIAPVFGPLRDADLPYGAPLGDQDEEAEFEVARQLFEAASAAQPSGPMDSIDTAESNDHHESENPPGRLTAGAEAIGPAMRALVDRVRETGDKALARVRERRDPDDGSIDGSIDDSDPSPSEATPPAP
jgi:NTE family protein